MSLYSLIDSPRRDSILNRFQKRNHKRENNRLASGLRFFPWTATRSNIVGCALLEKQQNTTKAEMRAKKEAKEKEGAKRASGPKFPFKIKTCVRLNYRPQSLSRTQISTTHCGN
jgi:hypothetical protein